VGKVKIVPNSKLKELFPMMEDVAKVMRKYGYKHRKFGGNVVGGIYAPGCSSLTITVDLPREVVTGVSAVAAFEYRR